MKIVLTPSEFTQVYDIIKTMDKPIPTEGFQLIFGNVAPSIKTTSINGEIIVEMHPSSSKELFKVFRRYAGTLGDTFSGNVNIKNAFRIKNQLTTFFYELQKTAKSIIAN